MGKQSSSFNYRVVRLVGAPEPRPGDPANPDGWHHDSCEAQDNTTSGHRCHARREYACCYDYVTGRAGRVTTRTAPRCRRHAEIFCRNHGIDIEAAPEVPYDRLYHLASDHG